MQLACEMLAQDGKMVLLDSYEIENGQIKSYAKYDDLGEYDIVPVSMWIESICQNGEILLRSFEPNIQEAFLTNISQIPYLNLCKKELRDIVFFAKKLLSTKQYFKSEIAVVLKGKEQFKCTCTHYTN